jgi:hypothetical protein
LLRADPPCGGSAGRSFCRAGTAFGSFGHGGSIAPQHGNAAVQILKRGGGLCLDRGGKIAKRGLGRGGDGWGGQGRGRLRLR